MNVLHLRLNKPHVQQVYDPNTDYKKSQCCEDYYLDIFVWCLQLALLGNTIKTYTSGTIIKFVVRKVLECKKVFVYKI